MNRRYALIGSGLMVFGLAAGFGALEEGGVVTERSVAASSTTEYVVDPVHSNVIFKIRHAGVANFYGRFNQVDGTVQYDGDDFTKSTMSFKVLVSSVDTNSRTRDGHIKGAEFFNFKQYPEMVFESTSIEPTDSGSYTLTGNLTLHGVTKVIEATLGDVRTGQSRDREVLGFEAKFSIKRSDFGIMKYLADDLSESGPLGNTVELIVAVEAGIE